MNIEQWILQVSDIINNQKNGFKFQGQSLQFGFLAGKKVEKTPGSTETNFSLKIPTVQLSQLNPSETSSAILVTQVVFFLILLISRIQTLERSFSHLTLTG